jgi:hypothetical protein
VISADKNKIIVPEVSHQYWICIPYIIPGIFDQFKNITIENDPVDVIDISYAFNLHYQIHLIPLKCTKVVTCVDMQI